MRLSIIVVNYNVKYFLEQCLYSVRKAVVGIDAEVFVVDNNSVDGSVEMLIQKFPEVKVIANKENTGFSVANNQAMRVASGEYMLLLNPDTVVQEDTFSKVLDFMDAQPDAGGLGVKMLDGKGNFLPESKRGLPTPSVAFYKIFGLAALFPNSKLFGRYHLGFLSKDETHEVDVLSGAFMLMRKTTLDKVGLLDEAFFMYGEDIDLSYRIQLGGYKNYYYPHTKIIHYKGESTKKSSVNYVFVFYNAMIIFAQKHFSQRNAQLFSFFINIAIYLRAGLAIIARMFKRMLVPVMDIGLLYVGIYFLKIYWEQNHKYVKQPYPAELMTVVIPCYIAAWLIAIFFSGGYDKPIRLSKIIRGILIGTLLIATVYAFLGENWRFSRALIVLGAFWAVISLSGLRMVLSYFKVKGGSVEGLSAEKKVIIVAESAEGERVLTLLRKVNNQLNFIGLVHPDSAYHNNVGQYLGTINQLKEVIALYGIQEVIFATKSLSLQYIIDRMADINRAEVDYKIAPEESLFIIGSNSVDDPGDLYTIDINMAIIKPMNQRNKRLFDVFVSAICIITLPISIFVVKNPVNFVRNCIKVLVGINSWVGYTQPEMEKRALPAIKKGILNPLDGLQSEVIDNHTIARLNMLYAKHYQVDNDMRIVINSIKKLGR